MIFLYERKIKLILKIKKKIRWKNEIVCFLLIFQLPTFSFQKGFLIHLSVNKISLEVFLFPIFFFYQICALRAILVLFVCYKEFLDGFSSIQKKVCFII
jgi:hypothetical protein